MAEKETKRDYVRVNDEFNVRLVRMNDTAPHAALEIYNSKSINISGNGLLINTKEKLDGGSILNIQFMKPNTFDFFKGVGKVVRIEQDQDDSFRVGINFINLSM